MKRQFFSLQKKSKHLALKEQLKRFKMALFCFDANTLDNKEFKILRPILLRTRRNYKPSIKVTLIQTFRVKSILGRK